jgi:hypothetical protein
MTSLLECLEEMITHEKDDRKPFEVILTYNDIKRIVDIEKRYAEMRKVYDDTQNYAVGLANVLHEFYKKESPEFEPLDRPDYVLSQIDNMISGILDRHADLVELVAAYVNNKEELHNISTSRGVCGVFWYEAAEKLEKAETALREFVKEGADKTPK